jgi:hypothetical protein
VILEKQAKVYIVTLVSRDLHGVPVMLGAEIVQLHRDHCSKVWKPSTQCRESSCPILRSACIASDAICRWFFGSPFLHGFQTGPQTCATQAGNESRMASRQDLGRIDGTRELAPHGDPELWRPIQFSTHTIYLGYILICGVEEPVLHAGEPSPPTQRSE